LRKPHAQVLLAPPLLLPAAFLLVLAFVLSTACTILGVGLMHPIDQPPAEALPGLDPGSVRFLGSNEFPRQAPFPDSPAWVTVFQGRTPDGVTQERLFAVVNRQKTYVGILQKDFPDSPLVSIFFELFGQHCLAGRVEPGLAGDLMLVDIERPPAQPGDGRPVRLQSQVNQRVFLICIPQSEAPYWNALSRVGVVTRQSLAGASVTNQDPGTWNIHAWQGVYSPSLQITDRFTPLTLP
jgi:hypothetical protein